MSMLIVTEPVIQVVAMLLEVRPKVKIVNALYHLSYKMDIDKTVMIKPYVTSSHALEMEKP